MPAVRSRGRADRVVPKAKPRADAYVGLLGLSLLALTAAMLFAFLNWNTYPEGKPKAVPMAPRAVPSGPPPVGGPVVNPPVVPPGAPAPGVPPGGQPPAQQPPAKK
ncbi:MAG TPA: hypothetical protein VN688_23620 [Gemmataceae bacterium]|nr:hypothetical protein [Gemmataceae bacterium]